MNIIPWRRRDALLPAADMEQMWDRFWGDERGLFSHLPEVFQRRPFPPVNVSENESAYTITMDCPGLSEDDFRVDAMGSQIVISGERKWESEKTDEEYRRVESQFGEFTRTVQLPENVRLEAGEISASYKKGVLCIEVPKLERTPASRIPVHAI